jgi:hypothetical protein
MQNHDLCLSQPACNLANNADLRELTAALIRSRRRLGDLQHLRLWNNSLRHRLWRAHVRAELSGDIPDIAGIKAEADEYFAVVDLLTGEAAA